MTTGDPTKHHYIPEFFLRQWTGDDRRLERYDRPIPTKIMVRRVFPSELGWIKNLYASPGHHLGQQWLETRIFQKIDSLAAPVLRKLNADPIPVLSLEERSAWTIFLRSLLHRTPEYLRSTIATGIVAHADALERAREEFVVRRGAIDVTAFEKFKANLTEDHAKRAAQQMLPELFINPRIGEFMNNLPTKVITLPPQARDFLTSDDPLARTNGIMKEDGHIGIAISPRRFFVSAWSEALLEQFVQLPPHTLVASVNQWTVESANYFVAARDRSQDRFIRNRFGRDPKPPILRPDLLASFTS